MPTVCQNIRISDENGVGESKGYCESVEFVGWCVIGLVIRAENDWHDVTQPSSCNASHCHYF